MSILGAIGGIAGSVIDAISGDSAADKQAQLQKEFAKNGIRWKVADAEAAGIHPLYALGAQTASYSPVSVGGTDFANAGQNLGTAIQAMTTPKEKADGYLKTVQGLTLQKMGLENDLLASQIRMLNQPGRGPGMPADRMIPGQGSTAANTLTAGGGPVLTKGADTPAQAFEDQYGEVASEIAGIGNLLSDLGKTYGPQLQKDWAATVDLWTDRLTRLGAKRRNYTRPAPKGY